MGAQLNLPSSTCYVEGSLRFSRYTCMQYIIGWCRVVVAVNSPMRVDARSCMNVFGTSDSKHYRCSRCGMSGVAFRPAHQLVGFLVISGTADQDVGVDVFANFGDSRLKPLPRPEVYNDTICSVILEPTCVKVPVKFGDSRSNRS